MKNRGRLLDIAKRVTHRQCHRNLPPLRTILTTAFFIALLSACAGHAAPDQSPASTPTGVAQATAGCAPFNNRIRAQMVFDDSPGRHSDLDPDKDGIACESLPPGIAPALWTNAIPAAAQKVDLRRVTDGDTIEVVVDGRRELVRFLGIDAPEAGGPYQDSECYGREASTFLERLLGVGSTISLEEDREDRDRYGRLLRWVWVDFGTGEVYLLNEALVRAGFAERHWNTPKRRYTDEVSEAEAFAQRHDYGLWDACE